MAASGVCFVTLTGSVTAALMLSQALYWQRRTQHAGGWWFKIRDEWTSETGMSRQKFICIVNNSLFFSSYVHWEKSAGFLSNLPEWLMT
ncbi:MAG: hypothetical protein H6976_16245 [Gammaproteobacteria bacterium]|nr:hypothetical protein [Gammaproteobacteria bacterium]